MEYAEDWLSRLNPPRRNSFFPGKMMGVAQFEREQRYGMGQRWLMNRLTLGSGILCGLDVSVVEGKRLRVETGVAVDPLGHEIVVARPVDYDPFKTDAGSGCCHALGVSEPGEYFLCLTYRECTTDDQLAHYADDCSGLADCQPDTTVESFAISLRDAHSIPAGFDCAMWTRAVVPTPAPAPAGPPGQPAAPPAAPPAPPSEPPAGTAPSIAVLRERLAQQFGASCGKTQEDPCVPLGRISVSKGADGKLTAALALDFGQPRVRIYSQSQMLDMILCLAECCVGGHSEPTTPPPTGADTLRVVRVELVGHDTGQTPPRFVALVPAAGSHPPVFSPGSDLAVATVPVALRVTFNQAIDVYSIPDPIVGSAAKSIRVTLAAQPQDIELPTMALTEQPNVLIVVVGLGSTTGAPAGTVVRPVIGASAGGGGAWMPGIYTLTLFGDNAGGHDAIASWPAASRQVLDGNWGDPNAFPDVDKSPAARSGDGVPGGDFVVTFEIRDTLRLIGITTDQNPVSNTAQPVPVRWSRDGIQVTLLFSKAVDAKSLPEGITVTLPDGSSPSPPEVTSELEGTQAVLSYSTARGGFPRPEVDTGYSVTVTLSGSTGGIREPGPAGGAAFDGDPAATNDLPTGDGVAGGDFSFTLNVIK